MGIKGDSGSSIAGSTAAWLAAAAILIALPGGIAVAGGLDAPKPEPSGATKANCPEADEAFEKQDLRAPTAYGPEGCPTEERVDEVIALIKQDIAFRESPEGRALLGEPEPMDRAK